MLKEKVSLKRFISREFFKAALLPLLFIELALLALYFLMNTHLIDKSVETLSGDRISHLSGIAESQTQIISEELRAVSRLSLILQSETQRFFDHPEQFPKPFSSPQFDFAPNGVYYKTENNGGSSLFYSALTGVGAAEKEKALRTEALDPLLKGISEANPDIVAVYLNTFDSMSRYYPFSEEVFNQLPSKMNVREYNFYYLADQKHNPESKPVWTEAYLDPMGKGWMMSCLVPVYKGDFLEGVAGIDITIEEFINGLLSLTLPWESHAFLVDSEGTIMAMPPEVERIFGLTELYQHRYEGKVQKDTRKPKTFNLLESVLPNVAGPLSEVMQQDPGIIEFPLNDRKYILCKNTVLETGWNLMVIADKSVLLSPITNLESRATKAGWAAAGFMVLFYILFLLYLVKNTQRMSGRIAETVGGLSKAVKRLGTGIYETKMEPSHVAELDALSANFESMACDLKIMHENLEMEAKRANEAKDAARLAEENLSAHQAHLEKTVEFRTIELTEANEKLREDILKRKQVEKALDKERLQLLSIFDSIDEPIYVSTADTYELLYVNEALKKYSPGPFDRKCYQVLQGLDAPCSFCTNDIIFGEKFGQPHIWEFRNLLNDRWFRCIDKAIQWPDGRMVRYEMAVDITEQKSSLAEKQKLMARLRRAEKMEALGKLAGGVAHDLNNILGGIVGYPDLLLMDLAEDSPLRKPIETIQESGLKASTIVQDLLTLARRGMAEMNSTDINQIISGYLNSPEHQLLLHYHPRIHVRTEYCEKLMRCLGSAVHLSKVIMNLVSNAAESMPEGGEIVVSTRNQYVDTCLKGYDEVQEGDYVVIMVADCGSGIHSEDLDRIFEPFFSKKTLGRSGTGLGMAVVWGIVKDHQGYIEVKSAVGTGTTFEIYLPVTREITDTALVQNSLDAYQGNNEFILVVDDIKIQREIAASILSHLGYRTKAVSGGEEAVDFLKDNHADLVILDMIMDPNIGGLETYKRILEIHPHQKAIIVSGFSETAEIRETQRLGAGRYVKKPYTALELGIAVKEELNRN